MPTYDRIASAYDKLAEYTSDYTVCQAREFAWLQLIRACKAIQNLTLQFGSGPNDDYLAAAEMLDRATDRRRQLTAAMQDLCGKMDNLNARIQNGVYNDEETK